MQKIVSQKFLQLQSLTILAFVDLADKLRTMKSHQPIKSTKYKSNSVLKYYHEQT